MRLSNKQINALLFIAQGVGAVFIGIFLAAYLIGLPSTAVLHSEPTFRFLLSIFGATLLIIVLSVSILAFLSKKR